MILGGREGRPDEVSAWSMDNFFYFLSGGKVGSLGIFRLNVSYYVSSAVSDSILQGPASAYSYPLIFLIRPNGITINLNYSLYIQSHFNFLKKKRGTKNYQPHHSFELTQIRYTNTICEVTARIFHTERL